MNAARGLRFSKMHGAGNDFVVLDRRAAAAPLDPAVAIALADRHAGVGCDQVMVIEPARSNGAVASYAIFNADGSASRQCGNGARCVAAWLIRDGVPAGDFVLDAPFGRIGVRCGNDDQLALDMGVPDFEPAAIGLAVDAAADPYEHSIDSDTILFGAVSMGNPHAVLVVDDCATAPVARFGPALQRDPLFRDGCNVGFAEVLAPDRLRLRVYERGAGETLACGSGACAAVAVLARRGLVGQRVDVELPGGPLHVAWPGVGSPMWLAGPTAFVFEGEFTA